MRNDREEAGTGLMSRRPDEKWNGCMTAVIVMLEELGTLVPLTAEEAAARFSAREWTPGGRPRGGVETSWDKDGVGAWIRTSGGGTVSVSFAVWIRDVDESGYFDDLEAVYEEGERVLAGFLPAIERSSFAGRLAEAGRTAEDEDEFIALRRWTLDGRTLTAGVVQHDTDLPVMVVVALEAAPARAGRRGATPAAAGGPSRPSPQARVKPIGFYREMDVHYDAAWGGSVPAPASGEGRYPVAELAGYLASGHPLLDVTELTTDVIGGAFRVPGGSSVLTDGAFVWRADLAEYVGHHRIALPEDFLRAARENGFRVPPADHEVLLPLSVEVSDLLGFRAAP